MKFTVFQKNKRLIVNEQLALQSVTIIGFKTFTSLADFLQREKCDVKATTFC